MSCKGWSNASEPVNSVKVGWAAEAFRPARPPRPSLRARLQKKYEFLVGGFYEVNLCAFWLFRVIFDLRILLQRGSVLTWPWWKSIRRATNSTLGNFWITYKSMTIVLKMANAMLPDDCHQEQCDEWEDNCVDDDDDNDDDNHDDQIYLTTATRSKVMRENMPRRPTLTKARHPAGTSQPTFQ